MIVTLMLTVAAMGQVADNDTLVTGAVAGDMLVVRPNRSFNPGWPNHAPAFSQIHLSKPDIKVPALTIGKVVTKGDYHYVVESGAGRIKIAANHVRRGLPSSRFAGRARLVRDSRVTKSQACRMTALAPGRTPRSASGSS